MPVSNADIPIRNFHAVADGIFRGGNPSIKGLKALSEQGFKTVLSFRWRKTPVSLERAYVEELGMKFKHIPLNYWSLPNQQQVDTFLEIIDDRRNYPIFVHCFHGADRTGLLMAIYRIVRCGWTFDEAYREMVDCGFHRLHTQHYKWALWRLARKTASKVNAID